MKNKQIPLIYTFIIFITLFLSSLSLFAENIQSPKDNNISAEEISKQIALIASDSQLTSPQKQIGRAHV